MPGTYINADYSDIERELDHQSRMPDAKTVMKMDATLASIFSRVDAKIHIITGALKASGKMKTSSSKLDQSWTGEASWGGASPLHFKRPPIHPRGTKHPAEYAASFFEVVYAPYERRRGGAHDFMSSHREYNQELLRVFKSSMSR